ncbi:hypothetical protein BCV71DRAFT_277588 [Rhizopus microsporus]|uniref:Uncharacterized protein n=1 Tax=Rhizopus microsporus TaxID=58291 RepID=A0A1X0RNT3_RHIZD|nr:hypothetical protein BCV71DRAFT_277588 [Rhizopus microsporus]
MLNNVEKVLSYMMCNAFDNKTTGIKEAVTNDRLFKAAKDMYSKAALASSGPKKVMEYLDMKLEHKEKWVGACIGGIQHFGVTSTNRVKDSHANLKRSLEESYTLSNQYVKNCTELSLLIKTWSYIFEEYFGYNNQLFIQWRDSVSPACKLSKFDMRLDLRIITTVDEDQFDMMRGRGGKNISNNIYEIL